MADEFAGEKITIRFDGGKCIHSRNCVLGLPNVFQANVPGPWINPDNGTVEELIAVARSCPSGAITYERHDGGEAERLPDVNVIRVLENGPLAVTADLHIEGQGPGTRATLCRCGDSKNKPYCDGRHIAAGFTATGDPATSRSAPGPDAPSTVRPRAHSAAAATLRTSPIATARTQRQASLASNTVNRVGR